MRELYTEIEIAAPAEKVWKLLIDFPGMAEWNPFIPNASGVVKEGEKIKVQLQPPDGSGMTISPRLLKVDPNRELRWLGHLLIPGLFDGEHIFTLEPLAGERVKLVHREEFRGILVGIVLGMVGENTRRGFEAMNQALKARVENASSNQPIS
jgi:hypothetical protein